MSPSDSALVERWVAARDADAFAEIVSRYSGMVFGTCRRILRNPSDAEEVAQECFLALAQTSAPAPRSLGAWLHTVATRRALDRAKAEGRRRRRESEAAAVASTVDASEWDDVKAHVDEAIAALPAEWRQPVVQRFLEGRTHEAIAEALDVPRSTVQYRIGKGLDAIAETLRRRGVTVGAAALATLLESAPSEAVPATLTASLGKLLIAAGASAEAVGTSAAPWVLTGGVVIMLKKAALSLIVIVALAGLSYGGLRLSASEPSPAPALVALAQAPNAPVAPEPVAKAAAPATSETPATSAPEPATAQELPPHRVWTLGRVEDAQGRPVAGARVAASIHYEEIAKTVSGADGTFALAAPEKDSVTVGATKAELGFGYLTKVEPGRTDVVVRLQTGGTISGRLTDRATGEGIAGAKVAAERLDLAQWTPRTQVHPSALCQETDADGRYTLSLPAPAVYGVLVLDAGSFLTPGEGGPEVKVAKGQQAENVDLALARGGAVHGTVFSPDGQPCPDAYVHTEARELGVNGDRHVKSEADGTYRLGGLAPGVSYCIVAGLEPYAAFASPEVMMSSVQDVGPVDLRLSRGYTARGHTVDDDGRPVGRVTITTCLPDPDRPGIRRVRLGVAPAESDATGAFSLGPLGPGAYRLLARIEGASPSYADITMPDGADLQGLEVAVHKPGDGVISGRVVCFDGTPVEGVSVQAQRLQSLSQAQTGADGTFTITGLDATEPYRLMAIYLTGFTSASWLKTMVEDVTPGTTGLQVKLGAPVEARGRVIDAATGRPITRFEVGFTELYDAQGARAFAEEGWRACESPTGEFRLPVVLPNGAVRVAARAEGYAEAATDVVSMKDGSVSGIEIRLSAGEGLTGIVTDADGNPLEGARVLTTGMGVYPTLFKRTRPGAYATTGPDGRFRLPAVEPGQHVNVAACLQGYGLSAIADVGADAGKPAEVTIVMPPEARLNVKLTYEGRPVKETDVQVSSTQDGIIYLDSGKTDSEGTLAFVLRPGHYYAAAYTEEPTAAEWHGDFEVSAGENPLEIPLRQAGLVKGRLITSEPLNNVNIVARSLDEPERSLGLNAPSGEFSFVATPGRWRVYASLGDMKESSNVEEFTIEPGQETSVELTVPDGAS